MTDLFRWDWVVDRLDEIWMKTAEHLWLTLIAVVVGFVISFPLAIFAHKHRRFLTPLTVFSGILYTIPSLALFAALVPFTGLSTLTAEIGLVSYTLLILIRNTVTGLDGVSPDAKEAAIGMGYTDRQLLWKVEIPLAIPAIAAGVQDRHRHDDRVGHGDLSDRSRWTRLLHPARAAADVLDCRHPRRSAVADPRDHHRHAAARLREMADPLDPST